MAAKAPTAGAPPSFPKLRSNFVPELSGFELQLNYALDVNIEIVSAAPSDPRGGSAAPASRFAITGPPRAVSLLSRCVGRTNVASVGSGSRVTHGRLSPVTPLSIPEELRAEVGIPKAATHYSFAYPVDCLRIDYDAIVSSIVGSADDHEGDEAVLLFFLLGGFVYFAFDGESPTVSLSYQPGGGASVKLSRPVPGSLPLPKPPSVLAVNSLTMLSGAHGKLSFDGPHLASEEAVQQLEKSGRLHRVTIARLRKVGISEFAWLNPSETVGSDHIAISPHGVAHYPNGAFVYRNDDPAFPPYYYALRPSTQRGPGGNASSSRSSSPSPAGGAVPNAQVIHSAFTDIIDSYTEAKRKSKELRADLHRWRADPVARWVRSYGLLLVCYYIVGMGFYTMVEDWAPLDVAYYLTTTVTTVGYGDFCPTTELGRLVTSLYAPIGTVAVMTALLPSVEWTLLQVDQLTAWPVHALDQLTSKVRGWELVRRSAADGAFLRQPGDRSKNRGNLSVEKRRWAKTGTHAAHVVELPGLSGAIYEVGGGWAKLHALLGPLCLILIGVALTISLDHYKLIDSVYWTVITMTTVGYGDLVPQSALQKAYACFFMPLGATTLAATVERFEKLHHMERIHHTNFRLVIDAMLKEEALVQRELLPILSEDAFILRVLVQENLVEEATLKELKGRYAAMLEQGTGLIKGEGRVDKEGVPKTVDAELVFTLLCQQGRIVHASQAHEGGDNEPERERAKAQASMKRYKASDAARHGPRGALTDHEGDVLTTVDMATPDGGFQEWCEKRWVPSLRERGFEPDLADWKRFHEVKRDREKALLASLAAAVPSWDEAEAEAMVADPSLLDA